MLVWAWQELGFLTGFVTGSRRTSCPEGARGWRRAGFALQTILHHEIAVVVLAAAVVALTFGGANQVGTWTFLVLWAMRQSAKLNLFLGVRNRGEAFLPDHLRYLASYFAHRSINPLFPFAVALSLAVAVTIWQQALAADTSNASAIGLSLVGSLMSLAILEHAFMVVPLPVTALWRWGLGSRAPR